MYLQKVFPSGQGLSMASLLHLRLEEEGEQVKQVVPGVKGGGLEDHHCSCLKQFLFCSGYEKTNCDN